MGIIVANMQAMPPSTQPGRHYLSATEVFARKQENTGMMNVASKQEIFYQSKSFARSIMTAQTTVWVGYLSW